MASPSTGAAGPTPRPCHAVPRPKLEATQPLLKVALLRKHRLVSAHHRRRAGEQVHLCTSGPAGLSTSRRFPWAPSPAWRRRLPAAAPTVNRPSQISLRVLWNKCASAAIFLLRRQLKQIACSRRETRRLLITSIWDFLGHFLSFFLYIFAQMEGLNPHADTHTHVRRHDCSACMWISCDVMFLQPDVSQR